MRAVLTMALKDLRLMSRDWMALFFIVGFPVVMGLFFGFIGMSFGNSDNVSIEVAVIDLDQSEYSRRFVDAMIEGGGVKIVTMDSVEDAKDDVRKGSLTAFIALPKGFGETVGVMWLEQTPIELGVDPSRGAEAGMLEGIVMQAAGRLVMDRFQDTEMMRGLVQDAREAALADEEMSAPMRIALGAAMSQLDVFMESLGEFQETAEGEDAESGMPESGLAKIERVDVTEVSETEEQESGASLRSPWDISFPQAIMWGVLGCVAGFAVSIVREKSRGTYLRLQTAPVSAGAILAGKATACFIAVLFVNAFMLTLGWFLGLRPVRPELLAIAILSVGVCFVGLTMLVAVIGKSEEAVGGGAWGLNVIMAMFGGGMVPLAFLPGFMRTISHFSPVKWGVLALEGAVWRDFTLIEMAPPVSVLIAIGLISLVTGGVLLARSR